MFLKFCQNARERSADKKNLDRFKYYSNADVAVSKNLKKKSNNKTVLVHLRIERSKNKFKCSER